MCLINTRGLLHMDFHEMMQEVFSGKIPGFNVSKEGLPSARGKRVLFVFSLRFVDSIVPES